MPSIERKYDLTIASGQSLSTATNTGVWVPVALLLPPNLDASFLTFKIKLETDHNDVYDANGDPATIVVPEFFDGEANIVTFKEKDLNIIRLSKSIKVRAGMRAAPVVQSEDVTITIYLREMGLQ